MKEQVQELGVRKWFGDDFIELQNELAASIRSLVSDYGNMIVSGCTITNNGNNTYNLNEGIAYLRDSTGLNGKFCRVYAQANIPAASFPLYIVQSSRDRTAVPAYGREYKDVTTKNIIVEYYGTTTSVQPSHSNYVSITSAGVTTRFRDALQSSLYRFVTDAEKSSWNGKLNASAFTASAVMNIVLANDGSNSGLDADKLDGYHASAFVLASVYTAADILAKLLTVDGANSGLNADMLDGYHAADLIAMLQQGAITEADTLDGYHASAFVLASVYTAADILAKLLTVDGASSGLDADKLDGYHAASFLLAANYTAADVLAKLLTVDGVGTGLDADLLDGNHASAFATAAQGTKADNALPSSSYTAADIIAKLLTVDGTGSGLDADKLDGKEASDFQLVTDMVSTNTANKGVKRDASGNFAAGTITVTDIIIS